MPRYQIKVEYDGTNFVGWQYQKNGLSIQEILQRAIFQFSREKVTVIGAGRTDAGVHAIGQIAHFDLKKKINKEEAKISWDEDAIKIIAKINGLYPNPGAWFLFQEERHKILKATLSDLKGQPGTVLDDKLTIACGTKSIKIQEIQRQGKSKQKTTEFLLGSKIKKDLTLS